MFRIYNNREKIPSEYRVLYDVEPLFDARVSNEINIISGADEIIKKVDASVLLDFTLIKSRFGVTTVNNLSTGCKVVLTYFWLKAKEELINDYTIDGIALSDIVLNLTECGPNALEYLFNKINYEEDTLSFLLEHSLGAEIFDGVNLILNDKSGVGFYV